MAVATTNTNEGWTSKALSHGEIQERLMFWRLELVALNRGAECNSSREEVLAAIDRWLDELLELRGR